MFSLILLFFCSTIYAIENKQDNETIDSDDVEVLMIDDSFFDSDCGTGALGDCCNCLWFESSDQLSYLKVKKIFK